MATSVRVTAKQSSPAMQQAGRIGLEEELEDLLGDAGEVGDGGSGSMGWDVNLELFDDAEVQPWVEKLTAFLRTWGAPADTAIIIYPPLLPGEKPAPQRVAVFPEPDSGS